MSDFITGVNNWASNLWTDASKPKPAAPTQASPAPVPSRQGAEAAPPKESLQIEKQNQKQSKADANKVHFKDVQHTNQGNQDYADLFQQALAEGDSTQAAKVLGELYQGSPTQRAEFSSLLKKADDDTTREFLNQQGFLKDAGVFPFDFSKLGNASAADIQTMIQNLKSEGVFSDNSDLVNALEARGASLKDQNQSQAFMRKMENQGLSKRKLMKQMSNQIKQAPRYTEDLDRMIRDLSKDMSDNDVKDFLRDIGYYKAGFDSYDETDPAKIKHLSKETIQSIYNNLNDGDWGTFFEYFNFTQRDLVGDLEDVLKKL